MSSASKANELTLAWGSIDEGLVDGLEDLFALHWEEIEIEHAKVPLAVDWSGYRSLERGGSLRAAYLRLAGRLIGYNVFFVQPVLHHKLTTWAVNDVIYIDPAHRKGYAGAKLIRWCEKELAAQGVKVIFYSVKITGRLGSKHHRGSVGDLLVKLGYAPVEAAFAKYL